MRPELENHGDQLATLARHIIRGAPDVEPIRMAVALLAIYGRPEDEALIYEIGQLRKLHCACPTHGYNALWD